MSTQIIFCEDPNDKITTIIKPETRYGGLYLGNQQGARDRPLLKAKKITAVLTVARQIDIKYTDLAHLHIRIDDSPLEDIRSHFLTAIEFINKYISAGNVFVHCQMGISRSATLVIAYLMVSRNISVNRALEKLKHKRPIVNPNKGFLLQLRSFEEKLQEKQGQDTKRVVQKPLTLRAK